MSDYRIVIIADDPLARAGLAALLAQCDGIAVVGQMESGAASTDVVDALGVYRPEAVVWDLGFDPDSALDRMADARAAGYPVIALLADGDSAPAIWAAGARGLLLRTVDAAVLSAAIGAVKCGLVTVDPALSSVLPLTRAYPPVEDLTPRELDVLRLLANGLSNRAIAQQLEISEHTVKFHLNAILSKLGAQSRTEAVVMAIRLGLITV